MTNVIPTVIPPTLNDIIAKKAAIHLRQGRSMGAAGLMAYREFSEEAYKRLLEIDVDFLEKRR